MKHPTEKPFEPPMKFFTPELYLRFNSSDDSVADQADEDWETALRDYRNHLDSFRNQIPAPVESLAALNLHDAELLAMEERIEPTSAVSAGFAILSVGQEDTVVSLIYVLSDPIQKHLTQEAWPFSNVRLHWLYDEVDIARTDRGGFLHRILLSDGTVMEIPFISVVIHRIPLQTGRRIEESRQIA